MCTVSMIGDDWRGRLPNAHPWVIPYVEPKRPIESDPFEKYKVFNTPRGPTQEEFDALKREVEALKDLLKAAKLYDEKTGQKDCEMDEKIALIKKVADMVGVDLKDVF